MKHRVRNAAAWGVIALLSLVSVPIDAVAEEDSTQETIEIAGQVYQFEKKSKYEIDDTEPTDTTENTTTLGDLSISGDISESYDKDDITAFEIAEGTSFSLTYAYDATLSNAAQEEWHLAEDDKKEVNGSDLGDKIQNGALLFQTSVDGKTWVNLSTTVNLTDDKTFDDEKYINSAQLYNGCYYRIIVAYQTEKKENSKNFLFLDTSDYSDRKNAEVYEFYASYPENSDTVSGEKQYFPVGAQSGYTKGKKKNDYQETVEIDSKNPHYGWDLGEFCLSGYTDVGDSSDVFLKTVGNKMKLSFHLTYDINDLPKLSGHEKDVYIDSDKKGSDAEFSIKAHNMKHGELIIKHTDSEGKYTFTEYADYLKAYAVPGADTTIQLFEEGDYEVHLNYAITDEDGVDETFYYQMAFCFKVRNGNCMVYTFDSDTGSELMNGDMTASGFRIDTAKSGYPKLTIQKQVMNDGANGLVEDTRFNRSASDGEVITDEGIYTITAVNRYNSELKTQKTIYVGTDEILMAYTRYDGQYTVAEINEMVQEGYEIDETGMMTAPKSTIPVTTEAISMTTESETKTESITETTLTEVFETTAERTEKETDSSEGNKTLTRCFEIGGAIVIVLAVTIVVVKLAKKKNG